MVNVIRLGGVLNSLLAVFHVFFWKLFNWSESLSCLDMDQQAIMQVLNIHVAFTLGFFGFVSILYPQRLMDSKMGRMVLWMIALFYLLRSVNQVIFWDYSRLLSIIFMIIFVGIAGIYFLGIKATANVKSI